MICERKRYIERNGSINMNKFCNINNVFDDNLKDEYHKILDTNHAWQEDITDFMDLNAFGKNKISVIVPIYNAEQFLIEVLVVSKNKVIRIWK